MKALKAKTPEVCRADIEVQVSLADAIDDAMATGEAKAELKGTYQVGKYDIPGAEVDRWRKLRDIPEDEREAYYLDIPKPSRNGLFKWWEKPGRKSGIVKRRSQRQTSRKSKIDCQES